MEIRQMIDRVRHSMVLLLAIVLGVFPLLGSAVCEHLRPITFAEFQQLDLEYRLDIRVGSDWPKVKRELRHKGIAVKEEHVKDNESERTTFDTTILLPLDDETSELTVIAVKDDKVTALVGGLVDKHGTATMTGDDVLGLVKDYEEYLCWRYGDVAMGDSLSDQDRITYMGKGELITSRTAHDKRTNYDLFVVRRPEDESGYAVLAVMTTRTDD